MPAFCSWAKPWRRPDWTEDEETPPLLLQPKSQP
jgi:hypothetical protein